MLSKRSILAFALLFATFLQVHAALPPESYHLVMGNPSAAKEDATHSKNNFLMKKRYYALSYNNEKGIPNWVSWHLSHEYLGTAPRKPRFDTDSTLPHGFNAITHNDYTGSGFDRGHMCPHSDRAFDQEMSFATFIMTNILPQSHENNAGSWESLEQYGRYLADRQRKDLFIVSGPIGKGGVGKNGPAETIANGKVVVPKSVFKVILVTDRDDHQPDPRAWVDADSRLIAVIMPNDRTVPDDNWPQYRTTVEEVEKQTGYKFFSEITTDNFKEKKKHVDAERIIRIPKPVHH